jgi:hypothetical protein
MAEPEINVFLTHLAIMEKASASTQNHTLSAFGVHGFCLVPEEKMTQVAGPYVRGAPASKPLSGDFAIKYAEKYAEGT